jgi:ergothioneine biosynthesis protein EgtB
VSAHPLDELAGTWRRSDEVLDFVAPEAYLSRPIALRQPFVFYLGHLPAFSWNQIGRGLGGRAPLDPALDELFARGIDPVDVDAYTPAVPEPWPSIEQTRAYRDRARDALLEEARRLDASSPHARQVLGTVLEHELMHQETLLYMVRRLPLAHVVAPADRPAYVFEGAAAPGVVEIPAGRTVLGAARDALGFGWDNEFPEQEVEVGAFRIDRTPVRHRDFLPFMDEGGFERRELWTPEGWEWRQRQDVRHPPFWTASQGSWLYRALFDELPLDAVMDWPVSVSWATAAAFARWRGGRIPTEPELHRAAYATPDGALRRHPWGDTPPDCARGNMDFHHWSPTPVGAHPEGASAWGVLEPVGNGWEWTSTPFAPLPGFEAMPNYPGYSADFFDGRHYVMLGASWATDARLVRRSFRNWFQPYYPHTFAKFRCVYEAD